MTTGVNGAGKSTTMAILTHDIESTSGSAYVAGLPLTDPRTMLHIGPFNCYLYAYIFMDQLFICI
jgi:ABC-type multidrug transport system ATPase subunit